MQPREIHALTASPNHPAAITLGSRTMSYLRDFNMAAFWAGITGFVWYVFGTVPLHVAVSDQLGLTTAKSSSWMFIVWFSGAIASIGLSLRYRQPIPITWTIPGLVYLGTLAGQYTIAEIVGANLVAGALIIALGLMGVGARIMAWLPLPIVMGMFAGSILGYVTRMMSATVSDVAVVGVPVAAYLVARAIKNTKVPPLGLAMIAGAIAIYVTGTFANAPVQWALPTIGVPEIAFSAPAILAITLPMLILAMGLGNVQGIGFLLAQGYRVPINVSTVVVGISSVINALFGGHPAIIARTGVAIFAAPDAGPPSGRYWANLVAAGLTIVLAVAAAPVMSLIGVLPRSYVAALAGLAVLSALQDAFEKAFGGTLRFAALIAFGVAATPFSIAGITSAFWAIIAGLLAAFLVERSDLLAYWRGRAA
jgi:benzoate membrane transport protein